jgi:hypothetical protein
MNTFKIENARTRFFNTKEDYLAFRQAWKDFHNSGKAKPVISTFEGTYTKYEQGKGYISVPYTRKDKNKPLSSYHYMLYNLLRGRSATDGYAPLTNASRLNANRYWPASAKYNGDPNPWQAMHCAATELCRKLNMLKVDKPSSWQQGSIDNLLLPFGDTLNKEALISLLDALYPWVQAGFVTEQPKEEVVS